MARITAGGMTRDIDLVLFDKDGTLIDFHRLWGGRSEAAIRAVLAHRGADPALEAALFETLGYDRGLGRIRGETPLAVASIPSIAIVCATVLHQHGLSWHECEVLAHKAVLPALQAPPRADELRAVGDVAGLLGTLRAGGVQTGIVTTDDRAGTLATAEALGWMPHLVGVACGDDPIPAKPRPDGLLNLCKLAGVRPERAMMVGDSGGDMAAGRAAGFPFVVGVTSGASGREDLARHADVVIGSVMDLMVG